MSSKPIRVLLVDDSPLALVLLQRMLSASPEIEVVGVATHGRQALELIPHLKPDVLCTDFHMPDMNGLELAQEVMSRFPCPILVVSSAIGDADSDWVFALLEAGAVDVFRKPQAGPDSGGLATEQLVKKIKIVSGVRVLGRKPRVDKTLAAKLQASAKVDVETAGVPISDDGSAQKRRVPFSFPRYHPANISKLPARHTPQQESRLGGRPPAGPRAIEIVAIGASTGGPLALRTILSELPEHFPPVLCVQHISQGFLPGLVSWLGASCRGVVGVAVPGEKPLPGRVYFPEENTHLLIDAAGCLQSSNLPPIGGHRPSVDATFNSVAKQYGPKSLGVLLTGMGCDGSDGMAALFRAGAVTIVQDEATSVVYGMPRDAAERGAAQFVLPLTTIADALVRAVYSQDSLQSLTQSKPTGVGASGAETGNPKNAHD